MGTKRPLMVGALAGALVLGALYGQAKYAYNRYQKSRQEWDLEIERLGYGIPESSPLNLVMMGDSIGAGFGAQNRENTIANFLAREIATASNCYTSISNISKVGATSRDLPGQLGKMDGLPEVVLISIGANDVLHSENLYSGVSHLGKTVKTLADQGVQVFVLTCPDLGSLTLVPQPLRYCLGYIAYGYERAQCLAVAKNGGHPISVNRIVASEFALNPRMFGPDRFHPSEEGYVLVAQAMLPFILPLLKGGLSE